MANVQKAYTKVIEGRGSVSFRDLQRLLIALGFRLDRISGSHHIYLHPDVSRPINIQPAGKDAKPYQIRQLRDMIREFGLKLEDRPVKRYSIIVFWSEEDGVWIADAPDLKSCSAFGATPEEAVAELRVAMDAWLEAARKAGLPIPQARYQPHHEAAE